MKRQPTIIATKAINIDRPYPARATNAAPGNDTIPYDMKNANCVNIDCVYVRLKIARTDGISGSIMAVMKPHAKKSVVTAINAARRVFGDWLFKNLPPKRLSSTPSGSAGACE